MAFGHTARREGEDVKVIAVLLGSLAAGLLAALVLLGRNAAYRRIHAAETADTDNDGIPDVYGTHGPPSG